VAEWPHLNDEANEFTRRALAWLEGSITADVLEDTSYMVKLMPMREGVVGDDDSNDDDAKKIAMEHDEL
jgi:hypothetical protein